MNKCMFMQKQLIELIIGQYFIWLPIKFVDFTLVICDCLEFRIENINGCIKKSLNIVVDEVGKTRKSSTSHI